MSPLWKKLGRNEKVNHHFPELTSASDLRGWFWNLTCYRSSLVVLVVINILAGFFYLTQTNLTATSGYKINDLNREIAKLQEDNKNLNLAYVKLQSMDQVIVAAKNLNLIPVDNIETINTDANAIAINR